MSGEVENDIEFDSLAPEEMTASEALAFAYEPPYPAAEGELARIRFEDLPDDRAFLVRETGTIISYWDGPNLDNVGIRDEAFVYTKESIIENKYDSIIEQMIVEILPLPKQPDSPAKEPAKQPEATTEAPTTPGKSLFELLKSNPAQAQDANFKDRPSIISYMKSCQEYHVRNSLHYLNSGTLPGSTSFGVLALMLNGHPAVITDADLRQLERLGKNSLDRISALFSKPVSPIQSKLAYAIAKSSTTEPIPIF